jgi:hypothetical protein
MRRVHIGFAGAMIGALSLRGLVGCEPKLPDIDPPCEHGCPSGLECGPATCEQLQALNSEHATHCWAQGDSCAQATNTSTSSSTGGGPPPGPAYLDACLAPDPRNTGNTDLLVLGFGVAEFDLRRPDEEGESVTFDFNAPEGTTEVHCGLFACPPIIEEDVCKIRRIVNTDDCLVGSRRILGREGTFDLADPAIEEPEPADEAELGTCPRVQPRRVPPTDGKGNVCPEEGNRLPKRPRTRLLAGCWAYSEQSLTAATQLQPVRVADIGAFAGFTTDCTSEATDGFACDLPVKPGASTSVLGRCSTAEGSTPACVPQCLIDTDCNAYDALLPKVPDGAVRLCEFAGSTFGICVNRCRTAECTESSPR